MARKSAAAKRSTQKRDLVRKPGGAAYAKRTSGGQFKDMDDVGRSQRRDRQTKASKTVKSGFGDQGDRKGTAAKKK